MTCERCTGAVLVLALAVACPALAQDETPPSVSTTIPADGDVQVTPAILAVTVQFDEQMDRDTYADHVYLTLGDDPAGPRLAPSSFHTGGTYCSLGLGGELAPSTLYGVHVTTAVADLAGNRLATPFLATFTTEAAGSDLEPPLVVLTDPFDGAVGVPVTTAAVEVQFNESMDPATFADGIEVRVGLDTSGPIVAVGDVLPGATSCRLVIDQELDAGTVHSIHVAPSVTDLAGNGLVEPFVSSFRTVPAAVDTSAPFVTSTYPGDGATGVAPDLTGVRVDFNEIMDIDTYADHVTIAGPGAEVSGLVVGISYVVVLLGKALDATSAYTVTVGTEVADVAGNHLAAPAVATFTTSEQVPVGVGSWGDLKARFR